MYSQEQTIDKIQKFVDGLASKRWTQVSRVQDLEGFGGIYYKKIPYGVRTQVIQDHEGFDHFDPDSLWGGSDQHYYFRFTFKVPEVYDGKTLLMFISTGADDIWNTDNPQMMIYVNGKLSCAMDMNHDHVKISESATFGDVYEIGIYAYSNTENATNSLGIRFTSEDKDMIRLYYDIETPFEVLKSLPEDDSNRQLLIDVLSKAISLDPKEISDYLLNNLYGKDIPEATVKSIGHTHIDVAWKWPLRQTREKVIRSWTNVLKLMDRYPEYHFMASTPQMYEFVSEDEPELFDRIKEKVKEGRFEPEGCMWLEPDCNIPSGESLIRQIIYGQRYFKENFGHETQVLWIPDAFGYSSAFPQILSKSGIKYFMTTKLSWNDTNRLPYDLMYFKGIDGSKVLLYVITTCDNKNALEAGYDKLLNYTYNGLQNPSEVMGTWNAFRQKDITNNVLTCYGYGDGGGGPTEDMLERSRRMSLGIPGCPRTEQTSLTDFFHKLEEDFEKAKDKPEWSDELYLEYHRGTYTSMGANKRYNRLSEYMIQDAEFMCIMNRLLNNKAYPSKEIDDIWKIILLNQFHDILPGSSIKDVYDDSKEQYEKILADGKDIIDKSGKDIVAFIQGFDGENRKESLSEAEILSRKTVDISLSDSEDSNKKYNNKQSFICINAAGHSRKGLARLEDGRLVEVKDIVPAKGFAKVTIDGEDSFSKEARNPMSAMKREDGSIVVSTLFFEAVFDSCGEITGLFDKVSGRMVRDESGSPLGRLIAFEDKPKEYDCWNIDADYENVQEVVTDLSKMEIVQDDPYTLTIHLERKFRNSAINQNVVFYSNTSRIDFVTDIDWHEHQVLLKAAFPLNVKADKVTAEIQFGNVSRTLKPKTSWDKARFEMCSHRWVDMSEPESEGGKFGVAILNDCKYGYDAKDSTIRLTLLKSGIYPNPEADNGHHHFTYSLYTHKGDYRQGKVIEEAENLNRPLILILVAGYRSLGINTKDSISERKTSDSSTYLPNSFGIVDTENAEGIFIDTVKKAEESDDVIVRMYEGYGLDHDIKVSVPDALIKAAGYRNVVITKCDLKEKDLEDGLQLESNRSDIKTKDTNIENKDTNIETKDTNIETKETNILKNGKYTLNIKPFEIVTLKLHFS